MEAFTYTTLPSENHIRIIELLPGSPNDTIRCNLTVELRHHSQRPYDAISYVWGEGQYEDIICCEKYMRITLSLACALRSIRAKTCGTSTRLWADAISINQHNTQEKNHQVKRMGMVYENATQVHVWIDSDVLGFATSTFGTIRDLVQGLKECKKPSEVPHTITTSDGSLDPWRSFGIRQLLLQPWFSRVWVVQEVALSKSAHLHWGKATLDFADLVELASFYDGSSNLVTLIGGENNQLRLIKTLFQCVYRTYGKTGSWGSNRSAHFKRLSQQHPPNSGLFLDILSVGKILRASEARDHIYSFLGNPLALDSQGNLIIEPDYNKPEDQVNLELACALLSRLIESPYVLCFVQHSSEDAVNGKGGPSWVPRWKNESTEQQKITFTIGNIGLGSTAGGSFEKLQYNIQDNKILVLQGLVIDQVCWTSLVILKSENFALDPQRWDPRIKKHFFIDRLWGEVEGAFKTCLEPDKVLDKARYYDDYSSTLVTGYNTKKVISQKRNKHIVLAYLQVLREKISKEDSTSDEDATSNHSRYVVSKTKDTAAGLFEREARNCSGRRYGVLKSGGFALVPPFARAGDVCVVFLGMATPFVIRPAGDGRYRLVGEAYIHGAMRGEFEEQLDREKIDIMLV